MTKPIALILVLTVSFPLYAAKSADECEAELGDRAVDRSLVADCLLDSIGGAVNSPRNPKIYVVDFGISRINSANGVEPFAEFINPNKNSPIKYIRMTLTLFNAVGDPIGSSIGGGNTKTLEFTGPLAYESKSGYSDSRRADWGPVWYNGTAACLKMQSIAVEFMNGKKVSFSGRELRTAIAPDVQNSCGVK